MKLLVIFLIFLILCITLYTRLTPIASDMAVAAQKISLQSEKCSGSTNHLRRMD
jgi:hypothetical protein